jgi:hypothetical protein
MVATVVATGKNSPWEHEATLVLGRRSSKGGGGGGAEQSKSRSRSRRSFQRGSRARVSKQGKCPYGVFLSFLFMRAGSQSPEPFVASSTTLTIAC